MLLEITTSNQPMIGSDNANSNDPVKYFLKLDYGHIQRVTRHQSISMVMRYDRNLNARENNPSRRLFQPPAE